MKDVNREAGMDSPHGAASSETADGLLNAARARRTAWLALPPRPECLDICSGKQGLGRRAGW